MSGESPSALTRQGQSLLTRRQDYFVSDDGEEDFSVTANEAKPLSALLPSPRRPCGQL
jgi:hypothetical protein